MDRWKIWNLCWKYFHLNRATNVKRYLNSEISEEDEKAGKRVRFMAICKFWQKSKFLKNLKIWANPSQSGRLFDFSYLHLSFASLLCIFIKNAWFSFPFHLLEQGKFTLLILIFLMFRAFMLVRYNHYKIKL